MISEMRAARARHFARLAEQRDADLLSRRRRPVLDRDLLRLLGEVGDAQALIQERIALDVDAAA